MASLRVLGIWRRGSPVTRACGKRHLPQRRDLPHAWAMGGSRLKRQRRLGICLKEGSVIAFPYLRHPRAGLSHAEWRALSPGEKLERLFRMSLDHIAEILSWGPIHEPDPVRLAVQMRGTQGHLPDFGQAGARWRCPRRRPAARIINFLAGIIKTGES